MPQPAQPDDAKLSPIRASASGKILLIDDGDAVRDVIRTFLEKRASRSVERRAMASTPLRKPKP